MRSTRAAVCSLFFILGCGSGGGSASNPQFQEDGLKDILLSEDPLNGKLNQIYFATQAPLEVEQEFRLVLDKHSSLQFFQLNQKLKCANQMFDRVEVKFLLGLSASGGANEEWEYGTQRTLAPGEYRVKVQVRNPQKCSSLNVEFSVLQTAPWGSRVPRPDAWE